MSISVHSTGEPDTVGPYPHPRKTIRQRLESLRRAFTTRDGLIGDYDYASLFRPEIPFVKRTPRAMPFFGLNDPIPVLLAVILGVQHALALLGGLISPPKILSSSMNLDTIQSQYLVSTALIVSGILSMVQIIRFRIYNTPYVAQTIIFPPTVLPQPCTRFSATDKLIIGIISVPALYQWSECPFLSSLSLLKASIRCTRMAFVRRLMMAPDFPAPMHTALFSERPLAARSLRSFFHSFPRLQ